MDAITHLEAALERITREDIAALTPARRRRLQASLGAWECLCSDIPHPPPPRVRRGSAAAEGICPSCGDATSPGRPTCGESECLAQEPQQPNGGVLALLRRGDRAP
jgi:hypothetical protein